MPIRRALGRPDVRCPDLVATAAKVRSLHPGDLAVVTDFDRTMSASDAETSWSVCSHEGVLPVAYAAESRRMYEHYHPIEIDPRLDRDSKVAAIVQWWHEHLSLFAKYRLQRGALDVAARERIKLRDGFPQFVRALLAWEAPVAVVSAGLEEPIQVVLDLHQLGGCHVSANRLRYGADGACVGYDRGAVTHTFNKGTHLLPESMAARFDKASGVILCGDMPEDLDMVGMVGSTARTGALKIGFAKDAAVAKRLVQAGYDAVVESPSTDAGLLAALLDHLAAPHPAASDSAYG